MNFSCLLARLTPIFLLKIYENLDIFLTIYTLFLKTEIFIDINVEIDGDIISQTSEYRAWAPLRVYGAAIET